MVADQKTVQAWWGALFIGLDSVFDLCKHDPIVNMQWLAGYKGGRNPEVLYHSAIACFASFVPDVAHGILLHDDRFLLNNQEINVEI